MGFLGAASLGTSAFHAASSALELLQRNTVTKRKGFVTVLRAGPVVMMKCTVPWIPYSRHKLTYENEAVFFAYSYITTNSQTRVNKPAILLGPWCPVTSQQTDGTTLGTPLLLLPELLAQGRAPADQRWSPRRGDW